MIFEILLCTDNQSVLVESGEETLTLGTTWAFTGETGQIICGIVNQQSVGIANYTASTVYDECSSCLESTEISFTANTIQQVCEERCEDPLSGGTIVVQTEVPHPTWIDNYGNTVVQGNAVVLGGPNGLYN